MRPKIGIPRGLWFYDYYPLWKTFYEELGADVILSDPTNQDILDKGVKNTVDEACLPVKIFHGHILNLKDKVDYIFLPKMMSVYHREYICPKFCGLPEMVNHSIKDLPPIIDIEINFNKSRRSLKKTVYKFGSYVTKNPIKIKKAYDKALEDYRNYKKEIRAGKLPINGEFRNTQNKPSSINIVVMGHPYNIYDQYGSMDLINKLQASGINIITPEMLDHKIINEYAKTLEKKMFWSYGRKLLGAAMYLADSQSVDGIIYLSSFGCGIDSIIGDLSERKLRKQAKIPFLLITIDEHTGEAGVKTRLEAFIDMIEWRKKNEDNLPAHG
ncbi:MAG: acyl-CoA dehydratase activase-related protein [Bacillota bacterium]|jgi:predicted nucleotide-binding protein (sugar kinase/HSP70/actin superfamily)